MATKEVTIWQDVDFLSLEELKKYKEEMQEYRREDGEEDLSDDELYQAVCDDNAFSWDCEKENFNIPSNPIVLFARVGTWQGFRSHCFQIGNNINKILYSPMKCDTCLKLYADRFNVRGVEYHHDSRFAGGANEYLYREIKDEFVGREDEVLPRCQNEDGTINYNKIKYYTKSLRPYVKKVFGGDKSRSRKEK